MRLWQKSLILAVTTVVAGAGCGSSSGSGHRQAEGSTKTSGSVPTAVANNLAKRQDVTLTGCASAPGGWLASGTAHNLAKSSTKYSITVFFTTDQATVESYGTTVVDVSPGKDDPWKVLVRFQADPSTMCVLRGVG